MENNEIKWYGPISFHEAIEEWARNNKTIMYQFNRNGIPHSRSVMHGGIPTTHNIYKKHILEAEWYIEK